MKFENETLERISSELERLIYNMVSDRGQIFFIFVTDVFFGETGMATVFFVTSLKGGAVNHDQLVVSAADYFD